MIKNTATWLLLMTGIAGLAMAAPPPEMIHFQGVLRDASGSPVEGDHDLEFRFFSHDTGGTHFLTYSHPAVEIDGGMFNVPIGSGTPVTGAYDSLDEMFAGESTVYLEVQVDTDPGMAPRIRIASGAFALNAGRLDGMGSEEFIDKSAEAETKLGQLTISPGGGYGIEAEGIDAGGVFRNTAPSSGRGIKAYGADDGGYFECTDAESCSFVEVAGAQTGVYGRGNVIGAYFYTCDGTGDAALAHVDKGIWAKGTEMGGHFEDEDSPSWAKIAHDIYGIEAAGSWYGGFFYPTAGYAVASAKLGIDGGTGIRAKGIQMGGEFEDLDGTSFVRLAYSTHGVEAEGTIAGGYFEDSNSSGLAWVGYGDRGVWGKGNFAGATFTDLDDDVWADVAQERDGTNYKIRGVGTVSFVQNHPGDPGSVITYAAPEGDEVAVYTRGTARLVDGEARIGLGETFRWVANPDVGLTAHLTPRSDCGGLFVESLDTEELVVGELGGGASTAVFDYIVFGLRIGFERMSPVAPKDREALLPSPEASGAFFALHPELRRHTALARFTEMKSTVTGTPLEELDLSGADELRAAIVASGWQGIDTSDPATEEAPAVTNESADSRADVAPERRADGRSAGEPSTGFVPIARVVSRISEVQAESGRPAVPEPLPHFPLSGDVEVGDLLALDPDRPGRLRLTDSIADPGVVGIAAGEPVGAPGDLRVPVASYGFALVKVDAGYGAIRPGDLLTTSPTPGHAMRSDDPRPGTILGKALDSLDTGIGRIEVLVMLR